MTTTRTHSFSLYGTVKGQTATSSFQTSDFFKEAHSSFGGDSECKSSRRKVIFTPKNHRVERETPEPWAKASSQGESTCTMPVNCSRTVLKNSQDNDSTKETKKAQNFSNIMNMMSSTTNKKVVKEKNPLERQKTQKYGKRKLEYIDSDSEEEETQVPKETEKVERQTKQVKVVAPEPIYTKIYLYNSSRTEMYCFPVFRESDLRFSAVVQDTLRETDIDNDCETEMEILECSIKQVKRDLADGIKMQKEEEAQAQRKVSQGIRVVCSQEDNRREGEVKEKSNEEEGTGFWNKVSQVFKGSFSQDDKKF